MNVSARGIKQKELEKRYALLIEEYETINQQSYSTLNKGEQLRLQRQSSETYKEIERVEAELKEIERITGSTTHTASNWQLQLPKLNFRQAIKAFTSVLTRFENRVGAAVFLIQNSDELCGDLCATRLYEILYEQSIDIRHIPIEFLTYDILDEIGLLQRIGAYVGLAEITQGYTRYILDIVNRFDASFQAGCIVFIEMTVQCDPTPCQQLIPWFLDNIWRPLIQRLFEKANEYPLAKVIMLIRINTNLTLNNQTSCTTRQFNSDRVLSLPLSNWKEDEISAWLYAYSDTKEYLTTEQIKHAVRSIYSTSKGNPLRVRNALEGLLQRLHRQK